MKSMLPYPSVEALALSACPARSVIRFSEFARLLMSCVGYITQLYNHTKQVSRAYSIKNVHAFAAQWDQA